MIAEELKVVIRAETAKAVRELGKVQDQSKKTEISAKNLASQLVKNVAGWAALAAGVRSAVKFLGESARAASDAEETFAKFNTVFRDTGDNASSAMRDLADSFDLADSTAAKLLGNTGDLLTGFGLTQDSALELSDATTRLSIDLASFTNAQGGAEAVSRALTAAYAGERESLKTYGIVITEADVQAQQLKNTQKGLTFESERQAKAFATLQLAQEQSKNAIGDYERTAESAKNTQRRLNEQTKEFTERLGESINEGLTPFRAALADYLSALNNAAEGRDLRAADPRDINNLKAINSLIEEQRAKLEDLRSVYADALSRDERGAISLVKIEEDKLNAYERQRAAIADIARYQALEQTPAAIEAAAAAQRQADWEALHILRSEAQAKLLQERQKINEDLEIGIITQAEAEERRVNALDDAIKSARELVNEYNAIAGQDITDGLTPVAPGDNITLFIQNLLNQLEDGSGEAGEESGAAFAESFSDSASSVMGQRYAAMFEEFRRANLGLLDPDTYTDAAEAADEYAEKIATIQSSVNNVSAAFNAGIGAINAWSWAFDQALENSISKIEDQIEAMTDRHEREQAFAEAAGATSEQIAEMRIRQIAEQEAAEDELEAKKRKLAKQQFQRKKSINIANALMNTAEAVTSALTAGPIIGPILAGVVGSLGAAQVAGIAAQPVPKFEKGGSFVTNGPQTIEVGDGSSPRERVTVEPLSGPYKKNIANNKPTIIINNPLYLDENGAVLINDQIKKAAEVGLI